MQAGGYTVTVMAGPYVVDGTPTQDAVAFASELVAKLDEMRSFATAKLLPVYNDVWLDDDHGSLTAAEFGANLAEPEIVIYDEIGAASIYFSDSDMFGGHTIDVSVDVGEISGAEIAG